MHLTLGRLFVLAVSCLEISVSAAPSKPLRKILFGSCIKQQNPVPIFDVINANEPDLFIFLGDNIYGDTQDMALLKRKYDQLGALPGFQQLRKSAPLLATWDDHDFGVNDGGANYAKREQSQRVFNDFWNEPDNSPRRKREGIYDARMFGPMGKRVQVILLDTRYFRGELRKGERRVGGPYYPNRDKSITMLGDAQWKWLERELRRPAEIRIIASSIQCIPEAAGQETWSNLPHERMRLFDLIGKTKAKGVVIISGDRHWSELSAISKDVPYRIHELTSSSMNQIHGRGTPTENRFRAVKSTYHQPNFGAILIDWNPGAAKVQLEIRDADNEIKIKQRFVIQHDQRE